MPTVVYTYNFNTLNTPPLSGAIHWFYDTADGTDGSRFDGSTDPTCLINEQPSVYVSSVPHTAIDTFSIPTFGPLTWESWGVPAGKFVLSVTGRVRARLVSKDAGVTHNTIRFDVARTSGGTFTFGSLIPTTDVSSLGTSWTTISGTLFCVGSGQSASNTSVGISAWAENTLTSGTNLDYHYKYDSLELTIVYGDVWSDLCPDGGGDPPPPPPPMVCGGKRPLSDLFAATIAGECLTLACCLKLTRADTTVYGFTTLDQDLTVDSVLYEAVDGLGLSNLRTKTGTGIDNLQITGLQTTNRVVEADMRGGRYDGARISLFAVDYEDLAAGTMILLTGNIGAIGFSDGGFEFEARSLTQRLSQQIGDLYSPLCRVRQLGDAQCKIDVASYTFSRTVSSVVNRGAFVFSGDTHPTDYYTYGLVTFTSGLNIGISRPIRSHNLAGSTASIDVQEPFPFNVAIGDVADLQAGCNRTTAVCKNVFNNIINIRSEPHIPRADTMITISRTG